MAWRRVNSESQPLSPHLLLLTPLGSCPTTHRYSPAHYASYWVMWDSGKCIMASPVALTGPWVTYHTSHFLLDTLCVRCCLTLVLHHTYLLYPHSYGVGLQMHISHGERQLCALFISLWNVLWWYTQHSHITRCYCCCLGLPRYP